MLAALAWCGVLAGARAARSEPPGTWCTGGPAATFSRNEWPIVEPVYTHTTSVPHGELWMARHPLGNTSFPVVHLSGTAYQRGFAHGTLLRQQVIDFYDAFWDYLVAEAGGNESAVVAMILPVVQDSAPFVPPHFTAEIAGLAAATNYSREKILWIHLFPETTGGHCSMLGASGAATRKSYSGKVLQLRALDYITADFLSNNHALIVYHDGEGGGFVNIGWVGTVSAVTGVNSAQVAISEIGVSNPDFSFGPQASGRGIPFNFLLRDILEFDRSVGEAQRRIAEAHRTVDLILGVGDGKAAATPEDPAFTGVQYAHTQARFFNDQNESEIGWINGGNVTGEWPGHAWHPVVDGVVYQGMDWLCPTWSYPLGQILQTKSSLGELDAEFVIRDAIQRIQTGNLHVAVYVPSAHTFYYSFSVGSGSSDRLKLAYQRPFLEIDTQRLFAQRATP